MSHRDFKDRLYPEFARIGHALASEKRLELVDLLAQGPRHVEALADETEMSVANVSQHLQVLRRARLVEPEREGTKVRYRLASDEVLATWLSLRNLAESSLAEVGQIAREFVPEDGAAIERDELQRLMRREDVHVIDVRPRLEFDSGHIPGAQPIPVEELAAHIKELPRNRRIVAYCRGAYCLFADEAVALLRKEGFDAQRLDGGWSEWLVEDRPRQPVPAG